MHSSLPVPRRFRVLSSRPILCVTLLSCLVLAAGAAPGDPAVRFRVEPGGARVLEIDVPPAAWRSAAAAPRDGQWAVYPEIDGFGRLGLPALPDLPARVERVALPAGSALRIDGVDVTWHEGLIPAPVAPYPAQDPDAAPLAQADRPAGFWPAAVARVVRSDGAFRTLQFAEIEIAPLQVDLAAGRFRLARRISLRLVEEAGPHSAAPPAQAPTPGPDSDSDPDSDSISDSGSTSASMLPSTSTSASAARAADLLVTGRDVLTERLAGLIAHGAGAVPRGVRRAARDAAAPLANAAAPLEAAPAAAATFPAWQFDVSREGVYRLTYAWVQQNAPGLLGRDMRQYRLISQGVEVPLRVVDNDGDGMFDSDDAVLFYGQGAGDATLFPPAEPGAWQGGQYTARNVYRLDLQPGATRMAVAPGTRAPLSGYAVPPSFRDTVRHEEETTFLGLIPQDGIDHWYASPFVVASCKDTKVSGACTDPLPDALCSTATVSCPNPANANPQQCCAGGLSQTVGTPGHAGGSVTWRTRLLGLRYTNNLHRSEIRIDGVPRDTADWDGYREYTHGVDGGTKSFTPDSPLGAQTRVDLRLPLGRAGATQDQVGLNWIELDYDRRYEAVSGLLRFSVPNDAGREVRIGALPAPLEIWELTSTQASPAGMTLALPRRVGGWSVNGSEARFEADRDGTLPATRRFVAVAAEGCLLPDAAREDLPPSSVDARLGSSLATFAGAEWLVVGHRSLLDVNAGSALQQLASLRADPARQGLGTAIIDVQDVYDEFSYGIEHPRGLRDFIAHAFANWAVRPAFLVLVGDATRDYENVYAHAPRRQFVPTLMKDIAANTQFGYYLSDTWFAAVSGSDVLPDVLVGRIPARSAAESATVFQKILDYERGRPYAAAWSGRAILVSENDGQDFINEHNTIYDRYLAQGPQTGQKVYEQDPAALGCNEAAGDERARITSAVNAGGALVSFAGHGSYKEWARGCSFFQTDAPGKPDDQDGLTNAISLGFHVHANCITAHFAQDNRAGSSSDLQYTFLEDWLTTSGRGAIGGLAPSHLAYNFRVGTILDSVYGDVFGKRKERVFGTLDLNLRLGFMNLNDRVAAESFVLLGDPATQLAVPAPPAPALLAVDPRGSGQLEVRWTPAAGAATYRVYRSEYATGGYTRLGETTATSLLDTGLRNCREYFYYVVAVDARGFESAWSNANETCYDNPRGDDCRAGSPRNPDPPPAVQVLDVLDTQQGGQLRVTWSTANQASDVLRYRVSWGTASGGPYPSTTTTGGPTDTYTIGGLTDRMPYYVVVQAEHCTLTGPIGSEGSGVPHRVEGTNPPDAVSDLRVTRVAGTQHLRLDWTVPVETVWGTPATIASVEVYGNQTGPVFVLDAAHRLATLAPPRALNTFRHDNAAAGTARWYYTVVAVDREGRRSAGGTQLPDGAPDLRLERLTAAQVRLTWTDVARDIQGRPVYVTHHNVYGRSSVLPRAECSAANRLAAGITTGAFTMNLPGETLYTWHVLAEDAYGGESVW